MTKAEIEKRLLQKCQQAPLEILQETLDFIEFLTAKHSRPKETTGKETTGDDWKQDFLSISQWDITEEEIAIPSWKIESF